MIKVKLMRMWIVLMLWGICVSSASAQELRINDKNVTKYSKVWTDDYNNFHKDVYYAYIKILKDDGMEHRVEIWHGSMVGYYKNGQKAVEGKYEHGKRVGLFLNYSDKGTKTGESTFLNGKMHGIYIQWSNDGQKMREQVFSEGKLHVKEIWWDKTGKIISEGINKGGKPWEGKFPLRNIDDKHWQIETFDNGKLVQRNQLNAAWWW